MKTLDDYNRELTAKLYDLLREVLPEGWDMGDLLWIETKSGVLCPKCKQQGGFFEMRVIYPRSLAKGYLCQMVVRCPNCNYEGTMLSLGNKKRYLEHLREFFPCLSKKGRKKIVKEFRVLSEEYNVGHERVYEEKGG